MKRFFILFTLVVFSAVSCIPVAFFIPMFGTFPSVAPNNKIWMKPGGVFRQDEFEQDREECEQAIRKDLEHPKTLSECLTEKGYADLLQLRK